MFNLFKPTGNCTYHKV